MKSPDSTSAILSPKSEDKGASVAGFQYFIHLVLSSVVNLVFSSESKLFDKN